MTSAPAEPQPAPNASRGVRRLKLWIAAALVFAAQVGMIFWLGNPPPIKPSRAPDTMIVRMVSGGELLALRDPTLFVLPHRDNFSGDAWLKTPPREFSPTNWTESPRPLELAQEQLGAAFVAFMRTNGPPRFQPRIDSELDNDDAAAPSMPPVLTPSRLRVEGDLARLRLLTPLHLPPQTNSDLLTNTVVQLVVDSRGNPFSAVLLTGCGKGEADQEALTNFSKAVRFAPREAAALGAVPPDKMTTGRLIFEWQTMPSNAPPAIP